MTLFNGNFSQFGIRGKEKREKIVED